MERQEVENIISQNIKDNSTRLISPAKVREVFLAILDWLEFIELGGSVADFDLIYRRLTDSYSKDEIDLIISAISLVPGPAGEQGPSGIQGPAGTDGAQGPPGADGAPGESPFIGENGNWWIGENDTGVMAKAKESRVVYDQDILGTRNGTNQTFTVAEAYVPGSLKVYLDGVRLSKGNNSDYIETGAGSQNNGAVINRVLLPENKLIFDFVKA